MEPVEITAGRLHLRPWRSADAGAVLDACSDVHIQRWTTVPVPYTAEHARSFVEDHGPQGWANDTDYGFAVCDATTGQVLGATVLRSRPAHQVWDVGYWTAPAARGQAVMSDALGALCRWAFAELGAERIEWYAEVGNWASRRVAERAGFTIEGVLRSGLPGRDGRVDGWIGARLAADPDRDTRRLPEVPELSDGVVRLRPLRDTDAQDIVRGYDDPERARWLPGPSPYGLSDAHDFLGSIRQQPFDGTGVPLALTLDTDRLVGIVHLMLGERQHGVGELGYWAAPEVRGQGLVARGVRLVTEWALEAVGLSRVQVLADVDNVASQRAAEKAGFMREGVLHAARSLPYDATRRADMVLYRRIR